MIDFRYHLVSLAAVLMALSIGIVLGAGPLNDNIGSTLSGEVNKLRQEKEALRNENNEQQQAIDGRDRFDDAVLPSIVNGRLAEHTVVVVALPEADDETVESIRETLDQSGAEVLDTVKITSAWASTKNDVRTARGDAGRAALDDLGLDPAVPEDAQRVDQVLAVTLTGRGSAKDADERVTGQVRAKAWTRLREASLVDGPDDVPAAADLVLVVGGPVPAEGKTETDTVDRDAERTAATWVALTHLFDNYSSGTVLAAAEAVIGTADASPVTMARTRGNLAEGVSTVDVPETPMGRGGIVLALVEQIAGEHGHYGLGADADAAVPAEP